jgi:hypothetical protein
MAAGDELRKSYASDGATYNLGIQTRQVSAADAEALASVITNKKAAKPAAHRSAVNAVDSADLSSAAGALDVGNSMHVAVIVDFDDPGAQAQLMLALFDGADDLIGITEAQTFASSATYRDGAAGPYVSAMCIFDVGPASKVKAIVTGLSTGAVINVFLMPL